MSTPTLHDAHVRRHVPVAFLKRTFAGRDGFLAISAIEPVPRKGRKKPNIVTKAAPLDDLNSLADFITLWNGTWNLYWSVNLLRTAEDKKAAKEDVASLYFLQVDIDPHHGEPIAEERVRIKAQIDAFTPRPNIIIDSGGGYGCFWRLREPVHVNGNGNIAELEDYNQRLATVLGGDDCWNIDRIMRLPGTTNLPTLTKIAEGRGNSEAAVVHEDDGSYDLADFNHLQARTKKTVPNAPVVAVTPGKIPARFYKELKTNTKLLARWDDSAGAEGLSKDDHSGRDASLAALLAHRGYSKEESAAILLEFPHGKAREEGSSYITRTINNARKLVDSAADDSDAVVSEFNERHAVVMVGGTCAVLTEAWDPVLKQRDITLSRVGDMQNKYANRTVAVGGKLVPAFPHWLRSPERREYAGIVFAPREVVPGFYNLWRGFAVEARKGDCSLFLAHIHENVCQGNDALHSYVMAWLATLVQRPLDRPGTSIALRGEQGTGKSIVVNIVGSLFSQHYLRVTSPRHLTGNFNAHLKDKLLVFADEAFWAGDKTAAGTLKALVTENENIIEFKGKDAFRVRNHVWLMVAGNQDWIVPAGFEERRFVVLQVGTAHMQDHDYFGRIVEQMNNGGREALLYHLLNLDTSTVNLRLLPYTDATQEQKILSMDPVERFWLDCLKAGHNAREEVTDDNDGTPDSRWQEVWLSEVTRKAFHEFYVHHSQRIGVARRSSETELGIAMRRLVPGLRSKQRASGRYYLFPTLAECRAEFDKALRCTTDWDDVDGDPGDM